MSGLPTLSEICAANWDHLRTNAAAWRSFGRTWEAAFTEVNQIAVNLGGIEWTGPAAQKFQTRTYTDKVKIAGPADIAENVARVAESGAEAQDGNKQSVLDAVADAERANFEVGEDYSVTDTIDWYSSAAELELMRPDDNGPDCRWVFLLRDDRRHVLRSYDLTQFCCAVVGV